MTNVDVVILAVIGMGLVRGLFTGFVRQVASLAGFVLAFVLAVELMPVLAESVFSVDGLSEGAARVVAFLAVFVSVHLLFFVLGRTAHAAADALHLTAPNRIVGGVFGGVKGLLLAGVMLLLLARLDLPDRAARENSALYAHVVGLMPRAWDVVADVWPQVKSISSRFGEDVRTYWAKSE